MTYRTLCVAFLFGSLIGCKEQPDEALLGHLDEHAEQHLRTTCPGDLEELKVDKRRFGVDCSWTEASGDRLRRVEISVDGTQRIVQILLFGQDRPDVVQIFERFVSPILPPNAREELRSSVADSEREVTLRTKHAHVFKIDYGHRISFFFERDR